MSHYIKSMKQLNDFLGETSSANLVIIDFFANWCGPCKEIAPKLDELGRQITNLIILKINVDECEDIVEAYDISVLPTFVFLKARHKLETFTGNDFEKLKETVLKLNKPSTQEAPGRHNYGNTVTMESHHASQSSDKKHHHHHHHQERFMPSNATVASQPNRFIPSQATIASSQTPQQRQMPSQATMASQGKERFIPSQATLASTKTDRISSARTAPPPPRPPNPPN